ncbi:MAG: hypothetical protein LUC83_10040 [Clostridiales bacterium]|nr:hypothetical protein [Clostridiales bacterium]
MDIKTRKFVQKMVEDEGWHKIGIIEDPPDVTLWNKEVELMYANMDGRPCVCNALYVVPVASYPYYIATTGPAKGCYMDNLIAWRELKNEKAK